MPEIQRHIHTAPYRDSGESRARNWIEANIGKLTFSLRELASLKLAKEWDKGLSRDTATDSRLYDSQLRLYEEMPICDLWGNFWLEDSAPEGFRIIVGSVYIEADSFLDDPTQHRKVDHRYLEATNGSGLIIDHCVGQFYKRQSHDIPKGSRLAFLNSLAEGLLSKFTTVQGNEHTFLIGSKQLVRKQLGIRYDAQPRSGD